MVCTCSIRNLELAGKQQCKTTLSQFDKTSVFWKQRTSHSFTVNVRANEKEQIQAESNMQTHSLLLPKREKDQQN